MPAENRAPKPSAGKASQAIGWSGAIAPIRIRTNHTATLLGTHEVLFAGGGSSPKSTELVQPFTAKVVVGPDLVEARTNHTATMLLSGKVLLAGGGTASAELYDPVAHTTTATGAMAQTRTAHSAIRLRSGKVLVAGGTADLSTEIYDPQAGTWAAGPNRVGSARVDALATLLDGRILAVGPTVPRTTETYLEATNTWEKVEQGIPQAFGSKSLTRLPGGRVVVGFSLGCAIIPGSETCSSFTSVIDPLATTTVDGPLFIEERSEFAAVRTVEGNVLFLGGRPEASGRAVEQLSDPAAVTLTSEGTLVSGHQGLTATLITGGDILVAGGTQASLDRRVSPGAWQKAPYFLGHAREKHGAARLHDGTVLVAGGENIIASGVGSTTPVLEAEIIDGAGSKTTDTAGKLSTPHIYGTLTTMRDGTALMVGGKTAVVEQFANDAFKDVAPLSTPRTQHTATILPSGRLLVVGGTPAPSASDIYDPGTAKWTIGPTPSRAWTGHGAVLLPNGLVLLVGDGAAEIFDETKNVFRATTAPGASREGRTAHLLADGRAFVTGGNTLSAEVFDPATETWSYTGTQATRSFEQQWTGLPSGRLVASGGHREIDGFEPAQRVFDSLAHPTGTFLEITTSPQLAYAHGVALSGSGAVVATGGQPGFGNNIGDTLNDVALYRDNANPELRPALDGGELTVVAGTKVRITGTGFANGAEASSGVTNSSAVNHPTAVWVSDAGDAVVPSTIVDFTDTTATWIVPTTALYGHGQLFVNVAGVFSFGKSVTITAALAATSCQNDAQCKTGFCTDGVCCDRRCDGTCEACSAAAKTSGDDGVCGAVPPGVGRCFLKLGEVCKGGNECGTGFCAQGVCCDSTCDGQCLSCNLPGEVGRCSAINEGSCGAACDGDHTLKQIGNEDVDCTPYKCSGPQCNQTCGSARDCVAPAVCSYDGHCVPPALPPAGSDSVCGCRVVGAAGSTLPHASLFAALGAMLIARRRRRR